MFLTTRERQSCSAGAPTSVWHRLSQRVTHICCLGASPSSSYPHMRHRQANMERYFSLTAWPLPGCCISLLASLLGTLHYRPFLQWPAVGGPQTGGSKLRCRAGRQRRASRSRNAVFAPPPCGNARLGQSVQDGVG